MNDVLTISNLNKHFNEFSLKDVSFSLPKGYIMGLIGKNGAGKTTTIKSILNMIKIDSGDISVFGKNIFKNEIEVKKQIGVVFDSSYFLESWNIKEVESIMSMFYPNWNKDTFYDFLKKFNISINKKIHELSKGTKMKLMLACAMSYNAKLLILDEPTSGLDPVSRDDLLEILKTYIENEENSVLFSTHITTGLEKVADYITYLNNGSVIYTGGKDEFMDSFKIVKGGLEDLSQPFNDKLIGIRKFSTGFEGLIKTEYIKEFSNLIFEPATMDDIMVYISKGDFNNGKYI